MSQTKISLIILAVLIIGFALLGVYFFQQTEKQTNQNQPAKQNQITVSTFAECVAAGYPVLESYPRQCQANGQIFTEDIGNELEKMDLIKVNNPRPNQEISSPLTIEGEARGSWFFEADFPVKLYDANDNLIATAIAQAQDDWMTEDFVPFVAEIEFEKPETDQGTLILEKDNPSGLPKNDDQLIMPVEF
jgi:uncharacterized protein HemX